MNDMQPGIPTTNVYFDSFLFSHDGSHTISRAIPDTLADAIPETQCAVVEMLAEQDTVTLPAIRLPQVAPSQVIAMRQRSLTPLPCVPHVALRSPMVEPQKLVQSITGANPYSTKVAPLTPRPQVIDITPVTPAPDNSPSQGMNKINGITYIPRSMKRQEPTVVDALIASGTLILICLCIMLFLYYIGL